MKIRSIPALVACLGLGLLPVHAQMGGGLGRSPQLSPIVTKLFGKEAAFSASLEIQVSGGAAGQGMTIPAKIAFDHGNARMDIDISEMKGGGLPPEAVTQMKAMGMDKTVVISRPDLKVDYVIFPGLKSYFENKATDNAADDLKLETSELGKETLAGRACVKQKAVVTDKQGKAHTATVWKAADVKDLPMKIEQTEEGASITMTFKTRPPNRSRAFSTHPPMAPSTTT